MITAIVTAAGVGSRFGSDKPKQFFLINGKPVVYYTLKCFVDSKVTDNIVLVLSPEYFPLGEEIIKNFGDFSKNIHICEGGETRQDSVYNGVKKAVELNEGKSSTSKIISHCAARPLVPAAIIRENGDLTGKGYSVNTVRKIYDTMLYTDDDGNTGFIDRNRTFTGLTPQSFVASDYMAAYECVKDRISQFTCVCSLMSAAGYPMKMIKTDELIHKVTVKEDINIIKQHLKIFKG